MNMYPSFKEAIRTKFRRGRTSSHMVNGTRYIMDKSVKVRKDYLLILMEGDPLLQEARRALFITQDNSWIHVRADGSEKKNGAAVYAISGGVPQPTYAMMDGLKEIAEAEIAKAAGAGP